MSLLCLQLFQLQFLSCPVPSWWDCGEMSRIHKSNSCIGPEEQKVWTEWSPTLQEKKTKEQHKLTEMNHKKVSVRWHSQGQGRTEHRWICKALMTQVLDQHRHPVLGTTTIPTAFSSAILIFNFESQALPCLMLPCLLSSNHIPCCISYLNISSELELPSCVLEKQWHLSSVTGVSPSPGLVPPVPWRSCHSQNSLQWQWLFWEQQHRQLQPSWRPGPSACWNEPLPGMKIDILDPLRLYARFPPLPPNLYF